MLEMLSASLKVSVPPCKTELNRKWQFMLPGVSVAIADEDSSDKQVDKQSIQQDARMFCVERTASTNKDSYLLHQLG